MSNFDNPPKGSRLGSPWWIAAAGLAIVALIYAGLWFYLALGARESVVDWIEEKRQQGFSIRYDNLVATGFPFSINLKFNNPGFGAPNAARPWGWEGTHLQLVIKPWNMNTVQALTWGQQMLAFPVDGITETYTGEAAKAWGEVRVVDGNPENARIVLNGVGLKAEKPGGGGISISTVDFSVHQLEKGKADHQTPTWSLKGSAEDVLLPWLRASPLGAKITAVRIDARLMGSLHKGPLIGSLEDWRDSGGTIEVRKLIIQNGPLKISTDGTLALDGLLQPIGALTARVVGFYETVDALQKLGVVKARDAITAKMVLGVLSRKPRGGGPSTLNLALTLQERRVYAGPVRLTEIPKIDWRALEN